MLMLLSLITLCSAANMDALVQETSMSEAVCTTAQNTAKTDASQAGASVLFFQTLDSPIILEMLNFSAIVPPRPRLRQHPLCKHVKRCGGAKMHL